MKNRNINGAEIILEVLKRAGVTDIFGYPGGTVIPIYDALYDFKGITHYLVRHEQGAIHCADGYARTKKTVGVCFATSGPGATNLVTGIMTAYMDSIPILAITGQVSSSSLGKDSFQETDISGITSPITKHNYLIRDIKELPYILKEAFYLAKHGRPGPVLVDIPKDIQLEIISYEEFESLYSIKIKKIEKFVEKYTFSEVLKVQEYILNSKKPLLIIGGGILSSNAVIEIKKLSSSLNIPVVSTLMGLGIYSKQEKEFLGMIGMHGLMGANQALHRCDLLIGVGLRFDDRIIGDKINFSPHSKKIHIDIDRAEIGKNIIPDLFLVGDAKKILNEILELKIKKNFFNWVEHFSKCKLSKEKTLNPISILNTLNEIINENFIIVTDVGQHQMFTAQHINILKPYQFCTSGGAGTMGFGLPAAIGAQIANPDKKVIAILGDGGFQMTQQELILLAQYKLPIKVLIFNNNVLGMVKQWQELFHNKRYSQVKWEINPNFIKIAEAHHVAGIAINNFEDLKNLKTYIHSSKPMLIELKIPDNQNVYPIIPSGKSFENVIVDDFYGE
ncbi:MAG: biosynthetic-type acetolactate synthase large subunit [Fusobacteriaceae bacterium]